MATSTEILNTREVWTTKRTPHLYKLMQEKATVFKSTFVNVSILPHYNFLPSVTIYMSVTGSGVEASSPVP